MVRVLDIVVWNTSRAVRPDACGQRHLLEGRLRMTDEVIRTDASALNRELTASLVEAGRRMGFSVVTEYAVPGGRIDVVWSWEPPSPVPGLAGAVPVVDSRSSRAGGLAST